MSEETNHSGGNKPAVPSNPLLGCPVCGSDPISFRWTDTHGVGVCTRCGAPHRILHYECDAPVKKPPECQLRPEWVEICKRYFAETGFMVSPGGFDMGMLGGNSSTYSGATVADIEAWNEWMKAHADELPK